VIDAASLQPLENWSLRGLGLFQQGLIDEPALFSLGRQIRRAAQVGLVSQLDEELGLLSIGSMFHYPRRYLVRRSKSVPWRTRRSRHRTRLRGGFAKRKQGKRDC